MKKIKNYCKKVGAVSFVFLLICVLVTGCSGKKNKNGSMKSEDGRSYGGIIKAVAGDKVSTAFFDVTVDKAVKYYTYQFEDGLYQADEGNTYLVVTFTIQNTYEKDLPMSITDFTLDYEGNKAESIITGYGKSDLKQEDFMENIFTLKRGESITKSVLFTIEDKSEYTLKYLEYYEDKFEGDSYEIKINPEQQAVTTQSENTEVPASSDTEASTELPADSSETSTAESTTAATEAPAASEEPVAAGEQTPAE
ncbi:MAG: DUF4352 domain-containing protein [Lachnospiraceae bacterium]|nr:DUF4352 domain-containing protein [Lachnospiraceae bacterium]